jgi:hypothetical protein
MIFHLYDVDRRLPWSVVEDSRYLGMWRVMAKDGTLSDMVNLTRAKDAAMSLAAVKRWGGLNWKMVK